MNFDEIKTKKFVEVMNNLKVNKALVVLDETCDKAVLSARNVADVKTASVSTINVYDILKYNTVVATKAAVAIYRGGVCIMANVQYYDVILKPVVTEKSMNAMADKKYTFLVHTGGKQNHDQRSR